MLWEKMDSFEISLVCSLNLHYIVIKENGEVHLEGRWWHIPLTRCFGYGERDK